MLLKVQPFELDSVPIPALDNIPDSAEVLFELLSPFHGRLCTLRLVRVLAVATGDARLARVVPDVRCESKLFKDVGDGGMGDEVGSLSDGGRELSGPYFGGFAST